MPIIAGTVAQAVILVWCIIIALTMYLASKDYNSVTRLFIMILTWNLAFMISVIPTTQEIAKDIPPGPVHVLSFIFNLFLASFVFTIEGPAWFSCRFPMDMSKYTVRLMTSLA
ncbi:uncharacterized protein BJ212DRAFT_1305642 [Suillus subaureus]|uniref:Uncharacterized protein n=1 Tax=Suillus subaureus TaxID=48587 RepID=A0A9P7DMY5_9AGAM|nr:uncharacterized protein BJ212DRAFT_1305642 [Suillus subaureus]KAG1798814.1 hypothetical protein BJ212DRAFT_1305642 [Suillus subaureus]